jgi:hypothetical protein
VTAAIRALEGNGELVIHRVGRHLRGHIVSPVA